MEPEPGKVSRKAYTFCALNRSGTGFTAGRCSSAARIGGETRDVLPSARAWKVSGEEPSLLHEQQLDPLGRLGGGMGNQPQARAGHRQHLRRAIMPRRVPQHTAERL